MPMIDRLARTHAEITAIRRDLHAHPELLFDTERTAGIVADRLRDWGCDALRRGIGRTGVVGVIHGRRTASGRVIGLRADMDALPITEQTGLEHASVIPGRMHACGHDGHTAMLLGAAQYLTETRNFDGTVCVIFQPAEEGGGGGRAMIDDGLMEEFGIQKIYGMHNMPGLPLGHFAIREGPFLASADLFEIMVRGTGGHAARPHDTVDATLAAAHVVIALQSIVARNIDPIGNAVLSVTSFETATKTHNVIPGHVELRGTVRTLAPALRDKVESRLKTVAEQTAAAFGATAEVIYHRNYPVMVNDPAETEFAARVARDVAGEAAVQTGVPAIMGAEDFAFMLEARPGSYILIGNGDTPMVHHPGYDFDDAAIPVGASYWARLAELAMPLR